MLNGPDLHHLEKVHLLYEPLVHLVLLRSELGWVGVRTTQVLDKTNLKKLIDLQIFVVSENYFKFLMFYVVLIICVITKYNNI